MVTAPIVLSLHMQVDFSTGIGGVEVAGAAVVVVVGEEVIAVVFVVDGVCSLPC